MAPVIVVVSAEPWATHCKLRACPFDMRDQFLFISDMTARGKVAIAQAGGQEAAALIAAS